MYGFWGLYPEKFEVSSVCWCDLLVVLFLIKCECFIRYLKVHVCSSSASGFALGDEGKSCSIAYGNYVIKLIYFLVGVLEVRRWLLSDNVVNFLFVAKLV